MLTIATYLCIIYQLAKSFSTDWSDEFEYNTYIDENQYFKLYWSNIADDNIEFGIEVSATGWIALGISERGQMINSDIAIGWVDDDGNAYLQDRYVLGKRRAPFYDNQQNLTLISGEESDGMTRLRFIRPKYSCDPDDISVPIGTSRIIWAFHDSKDPEEECFDSSSIDRHTNFGTQSINLHSGSAPSTDLGDDVEYFDITMDNAQVPATDTTYYCKLLAIPQFNETQYIVKMDSVIQEGDEGLVHHLIAYYCPTFLVPDESHVNTEGVCDEWDRNMPSAYCRGSQMIYLWAIGGNAIYMPEDVAMPVSGGSGLHYILLEMHYDNPLEKSGLVDSSGFRIWYQPTPRKYDAGVLQIGLTTDPTAQWIPPGLNAGHQVGFVTSECTKAGIPEEGVKIFGSALHQHTIGSALNLRHIRNGKELKPVDINLSYDFNYQQYIYLDEELVILPGDEFILDCWVNSTLREGITIGGESTRQEMCLAFLYYYPAMEWQGGVVQKTDEALYTFLMDAKENGYLLSDEKDIMKAFNSNESYEITEQYFEELVWDKAVDGAEEFFNRLYSVDYPEYNKHNLFCFQFGGLLLNYNDTFDIERIEDFDVYDLTTIECDENDTTTDEQIGECIPSMSTTKTEDNAVMEIPIFAFICGLIWSLL